MLFFVVSIFGLVHVLTHSDVAVPRLFFVEDIGDIERLQVGCASE